MRADGTERSLTHARSRPDHVVVMRRRLETTRAPATSGSPSRRTTSTLAPCHGTTRASPAVTIASTPTTSPASTRIGSPGRTSAAGSSIAIVALDGAHARVERALDRFARGLHANARPPDRAPRPRSRRRTRAPRAPRWPPRADRTRPAPTTPPPRRPRTARARRAGAGRTDRGAHAHARSASGGPREDDERDARDVGHGAEQSDGGREHPRDDPEAVDDRGRALAIGARPARLRRAPFARRPSRSRPRPDGPMATSRAPRATRPIDRPDRR